MPNINYWKYVGGCSELITNNKDGIIVPRNNENKLYESIKKLLKDESLLQFMSNSGFDNSKKFKLDKCTNEHKKIFSNLLKEKIWKKSLLPVVRVC